MPYELRGKCVVKADTGETVKCHPTKAKALAHLRALEANVEDATDKEMTPEQATAIVTGYNELGKKIAEAGIPAAAKSADEEKPTEETQTDKKPAMESEDDTKAEEKMVMRPTQAEVNYVTLSTKKGAACANCRWFSANGHMGNEGAYCHLIDNWPEDILPTGYCERHEIKPDMTMPEPEPIPVVIVEAEKKAVQDYVSVAQRIKTTFSKARSLLTTDDSSASFIIYKGADGKPRWFARYTNNFEDLEGDIFTEDAHDRYIARLKQGLIPMPELRFWHLKDTGHGRATSIERDGHIVMAWGVFDETPFAEKCIKFYSKNKGRIQLSHGSLVPQWARKQDPETGCRLFTDYNTFEITTLPPVVAKGANPFTTFDEDITMALRPEQKALLVKEFGEEEAARIERANEEINKTIEAFAQYKDYADLVSKRDEKPTEAPVSSALLGDIYEGQALVVKLAQQAAAKTETQDAEIKALKEAHAAELKAATDAITALKADAEAFRAFMNLTPRRASSDDKTALTPEQAAEVKKDIPTDVDPFWANLAVPKES
jgi:hypothetical protein